MRGGLGENGAKLEGASPTEEGSPTRQSTAVPLAAAVFDNGKKNWAELCLLTNAPFKPWGKAQDKKSQARKYFIEKLKLLTALKTHKFPLNCHEDWEAFFLPITSIRAGYSTN